MAVKIGKADFEEKVLKNKLPVLVDFYSDACIACKKISPALGAAEDELDGRVVFCKVNTNFEEKLSDEYEIMSRPTLILFINGEEKDRKSGVLKADALITWIESYLR